MGALAGFLKQKCPTLEAAVLSGSSLLTWRDHLLYLRG